MIGSPEISFLLLSLEPSLQWSAQLGPECAQTHGGEMQNSPSLTWGRVDAPVLHSHHESMQLHLFSTV